MRRMPLLPVALSIGLWSSGVVAQSTSPDCAVVTRGNVDECLGSALLLTPTSDDEVFLDGSAIGKGPLLLRRLLPGAHVVEVRPSAGKAPSQHSFTLAAGDLRVLPNGPGSSLLRIGAPKLAEAWFGYMDECDGVFRAGSHAAVVPVDLERLAVLERDRRLRGFVPTVAVELARAEDACTAGDAAACLLAGERASNGDGGRRRDPVRAARFFRRGCDLRDRASCSAFAEQLASGRGVKRDEARATALRERLCAEDDFESCDAIGDGLAFGSTGGAQRKRGLSFLERACNGGFNRSCSVIPTVRLHIACDEGDGTACRTLSRPVP